MRVQGNQCPATPASGGYTAHVSLCQPWRSCQVPASMPGHVLQQQAWLELVASMVALVRLCHSELRLQYGSAAALGWGPLLMIATMLCVVLAL